MKERMRSEDGNDQEQLGSNEPEKWNHWRVEEKTAYRKRNALGWLADVLKSEAIPGRNS